MGIAKEEAPETARSFEPANYVSARCKKHLTFQAYQVLLLYLNFASCFASCRLRMNSQAKSGIRLKATNHALGDKSASAELSFEPAISIAGEEGNNYRAKSRYYPAALA